MLVLTIRTDNPEAEIGLYDGQKQLAYHSWVAHRELGKTFHTQIEKLLQGAGFGWADIGAVVAYQGPGSFTGLRIGLTVANALAYSLQAKVVAQTGEAWIADGINRLLSGESDPIALPEYGGEANITLPRK